MSNTNSCLKLSIFEKFKYLDSFQKSAAVEKNIRVTAKFRIVSEEVNITV